MTTTKQSFEPNNFDSRIVRLAAQTMHADSVLLLRCDAHGVVIIASSTPQFKLGSRISASVPAWFTPSTSSSLSKSAVEQLRTWLVLPQLGNAVGISVPSNDAILALWVLEPRLNMVVEPSETLEHFCELLVLHHQKSIPKSLAKPSKEKDFGRSIAQSIPTPLLVTDLQGQVGYINPAFTRFFGYSLEDIYQKKLDDLLSMTIEPNSSIRRCQLLRPDGENTWIEISSYPRLDSAGVLLGSVATLREISSEIQTQERLQQFETDLRSIENKLEIGSGFSGRLEDSDGMVGLLQMLITNGSSGAITLNDAIIFLDNKNIVAVQHPKLEGLAAAQAMVQRQRGIFQFFPGVKTDRPSMAIDATSLILEFARQFDEQMTVKPLEHIHEVQVQNAKVAKAFMRGIGSEHHFTATLENGLVVLQSSAVRIVVQDSQLGEFIA